MTEVNKNIFEAYKSMYEEKMSPEECIRDTLKKEGGASGLAPLDKALKDKGHDMSAKEVISKMSDVKQHKEGDYILDEDASNDKSDDGEGMDKVDPKAVKKKFKDRKDQDIDNDGDVDSSDEYLHKRRRAVSKAVSKESFTVDDIRAMCHSKDHDCATYVDHPEFGLGKPVYESHAIPDEDGHVAWYDVEFAHGIEEQVPVEDMQILQTEDHKMNAKKHKDNKKDVIVGQKKKSNGKSIEDDTIINVDDDDESPDDGEPSDNGKDTEDDKKRKRKKLPPPPADDMDMEEPKDDGDDVKVIPKDKKKKNGNGNGKTAEISKIGEEVSEFTSLINELMASDAVGKKKKEKDGKEPESYDDINQERSKGETDFIDAHGKKDTVADGEKDAETTANSQKSNKQGKHVKQQTAKGDKNIIKSTEAPVKDKEVKDGEGKKSVTKESTEQTECMDEKDFKPHMMYDPKTGKGTMAKKYADHVKMDKMGYTHEKPKEKETKESTLMDMALKALKGTTVPEMKQIIASKEKEKNPFDARTRDAKAFLERMHKRKNGENGQYKDKDPKDLPMIKSASVVKPSARNLPQKQQDMRKNRVDENK